MTAYRSHLLCLNLAILLTNSESKDVGEFATCCGIESCCGAGWDLHCCDKSFTTCCYGGDRVPAPRLQKHKHDFDWDWDDDDAWVPITLVVIAIVLLLSAVLFCCCRWQRSHSQRLTEYTILPRYEYGAVSNIPSAPLRPMTSKHHTPFLPLKPGLNRSKKPGLGFGPAQYQAPPAYYKAMT